MKKSYSKIRHIQESNVILEQRKFGLLKEQSNPKKIDYSILETFLNEINDGGRTYVSQWVLDPYNPVKRGVSVKLTGREVTVRNNFVNTPLVWTLLVNGKKEKDSIFEIFIPENGKLHYMCRSSSFNNCLGGSPCENTEPWEELNTNTLGDAIERFNSRVFLQKQ